MAQNCDRTATNGKRSGTFLCRESLAHYSRAVDPRSCLTCKEPLPPYGGRGRPPLRHKGCLPDRTAYFKYAARKQREQQRYETFQPALLKLVRMLSTKAGRKKIAEFADWAIRWVDDQRQKRVASTMVNDREEVAVVLRTLVRDARAATASRERS